MDFLAERVKESFVTELVDGVLQAGWFEPHALFFILLPPLLFESSSNMSWHVLKKVLVSSYLLAWPGVLVNTLLTGSAVRAIVQVNHAPPSWEASFLLGAILSATDPVAVVAALKTLGAPAKLSTLVDGESLVNDGSAVVVTYVFMEWVMGSLAPASEKYCPTSPPAVPCVVQYFVQVACGGTLIGIAAGWILYAWLLSVRSQHVLMQTTSILVVVYATCFIAEGPLKAASLLAAHHSKPQYLELMGRGGRQPPWKREETGESYQDYKDNRGRQPKGDKSWDYWRGSWPSPKGTRQQERYDAAPLPEERAQPTPSLSFFMSDADSSQAPPALREIQKYLSQAQRADTRLRKLKEEQDKKSKHWEVYEQQMKQKFARQRRAFEADLQRIAQDAQEAAEQGQQAAQKVKEVVLRGRVEKDDPMEMENAAWDALTKTEKEEPVRNGFLQEALNAAQHGQPHMPPGMTTETAREPPGRGLPAEDPALRGVARAPTTTAAPPPGLATPGVNPYETAKGPPVTMQPPGTDANPALEAKLAANRALKAFGLRTVNVDGGPGQENAMPAGPPKLVNDDEEDELSKTGTLRDPGGMD
ncbi:NHX7 [Symbiodinium sp. CCMP2592]|nr:NHX7 [Symbiodinium sp. CCMP2592]